VAILPSCLFYTKYSYKTVNGVEQHWVPYSEHSNFTELLDFVEWVKPKCVIPTVTPNKDSVDSKINHELISVLSSDDVDKFQNFLTTMRSKVNTNNKRKTHSGIIN